MGRVWAFLIGYAIGFVVCVSMTHGVRGGFGDVIRQEAFQRGYMVECAGVEGYYWECEE